MSVEDLKHLLNNMADEVKPTSVHQNAIRRSKRTTTRHAVLVAVAVLAVTGGGLAGIQQTTDGAPAADPSPETEDGGQLNGVFYDALFKQSSGDTVYTWQAGDTEAVELVAGTTGDAISNTAEVSPDGRYMSYLTISSHPGDGSRLGQVMVYDVQHDKHVDVWNYEQPDEVCSIPAWSPDGERLFMDRGGEKSKDRFGFLDMSTFEWTPSPNPKGCSVKVARDSNGEDILIAQREGTDGSDQISVTTTDDDFTTSPDWQSLAEGYNHIRELVAVSDDGSLACLLVGWEGDSPGGSITDGLRYCNLVVDTSTGEPVEVFPSEAGEPYDSESWLGPSDIFAQPGGLLIFNTSTETYELRDMDGTVLDTVSLTHPDIDYETLLIGYVPGT